MSCFTDILGYPEATQMRSPVKCRPDQHGRKSSHPDAARHVTASIKTVVTFCAAARQLQRVKESTQSLFLHRRQLIEAFFHLLGFALVSLDGIVQS
jgi:hypothetical protein